MGATGRVGLVVPGERMMACIRAPKNWKIESSCEMGKQLQHQVEKDIPPSQLI